MSLDHGLALVVDVYRERKLEGFGLVLANGEVSPGFSWEWFDLERGDVFRKLQGGGRVRVTIAEDAGLRELVAIEFLDDITLRSTDRETGTSVEIVVRRGSALRLRP